MTLGALIVFRHGQTDHNASRKFQGRLDTPLNATGLAQAARTGDLVVSCLRRFFRVPPGAMSAVTSDLVRASATASVVARVVSEALSTDCFFLAEPALQEWDCGLLKDFTVEEFEPRNPGVLAAYYDAYGRDPLMTPYPEGESQRDVETRLGIPVRAWNAEVDWTGRARTGNDEDWTRSSSKVTLVSTHGGVVHCLLAVLGCPLPVNDKVIGNGDVLVIVPSAQQGTWKILRHYRVGDSVSAALVR